VKKEIKENTAFHIGDEVLIISSNTKGTVKNITSYLGQGDNIYLVDVNGRDKTCIESNLRLCRKPKVDFHVDMNDMAIDFQIEDKMNEIIKKLDLKESEEPSVQLLNACKLQKYLTINEEYEETDFKVGDSVTKNELYHGLVNGDFDSIINSYVFSEVLKKIGMDVLNVATKTEEGQFYVSNLVLINYEYYYFDVTLEVAVYQENGSVPTEFVLCCGALGSKSYEQFFRPLCVLDFHNKLGETKLPTNISKDDIDIDIVNKMLTIGIDATV